MEWEDTELSLTEEKPEDNVELDVKKEERAWEDFKFKKEVKDKLQDNESCVDELASSMASSPHCLATTTNKVGLNPGGSKDLFLANPMISVTHFFFTAVPFVRGVISFDKTLATA